jgi:galactose mutarotase-like enzyme
MQTITLQATDSPCTATFAPERGGNLASLKMQGVQGIKELLYQHDFFWDETIDDLPGAWPFCFPVCARLERNGQYGAYLYDGTIYQLPIHGFAWNMPWQVIEQSSNSIRLLLQHSSETLKMYPFKFEVELYYELQHNQLICQQHYRNKDHKPMPYAAGFHPYFLTPEANAGKQSVTLNYQPTRRLQYNETLTDIIGEQACFKTPTSITNPDINEQLTRVGEDKMTRLHFPEGDCIEMVAEGVDDADLFPYIQLYTIEKKPFVCVEPWMAYPNAMNAISGMRWLAAGAEESGILTLSLTAPNT